LSIFKRFSEEIWRKHRLRTMLIEAAVYADEAAGHFVSTNAHYTLIVASVQVRSQSCFHAGVRTVRQLENFGDSGHHLDKASLSNVETAFWSGLSWLASN
jgi:hypothetical protein